MRWAKFRRYALVGIVVLTAGSMLPSLGGGSGSHQVSPERTRYASTDCGTYPSESAYSTARVLALRSVGCGRALAVARAYDHNRKLLATWRCVPANGGGPVLFSCGTGAHHGNIRKWPHALLAKGEATPAEAIPAG